MQRLIREERGVALITAVLISVAVLLLGIVAVGLAAHDSTQSARNRERVQGVAAAEAGLDYYISDLVDRTIGTVTCQPFERSLTFDPGSRFRVEEPVFEDAAGNRIDCDASGTGLDWAPGDPLPVSVTITSVGTAVGDDPARTMQSVLRLEEVSAGALLPYAIFSEEGIDFRSNTDIIGSAGNDADLYTNGDLNLSSRVIVSGSVYARGNITMASNTEVKVDVHAGNDTPSDDNDVSMSGNAIARGNVIAEDDISTGTNTRIFGSARAGGSITGGGDIRGSRIEGPPAPDPPPAQTFPAVTFDQQAWEGAGYTVNPYTSCAAAKTFVDQLSAGSVAVRPYVVRVLADCDLSWTNSDVNVRADLAIVSDGGASFGGNVKVQPVNGPHSLFFILGQDDATSPCDFTMATNARIQTGLTTLVHTPCAFQLQSNSFISEGQFFARTVLFNSNSAFLNYTPIPIPGNSPPGWTVIEEHRREVSGN